MGSTKREKETGIKNPNAQPRADWHWQQSQQSARFQIEHQGRTKQLPPIKSENGRRPGAASASENHPPNTQFLAVGGLAPRFPPHQYATKRSTTPPPGARNENQLIHHHRPAVPLPARSAIPPTRLSQSASTGATLSNKSGRSFWPPEEILYEACRGFTQKLAKGNGKATRAAWQWELLQALQDNEILPARFTTPWSNRKTSPRCPGQHPADPQGWNSPQNRPA